MVYIPLNLEAVVCWQAGKDTRAVLNFLVPHLISAVEGVNLQVVSRLSTQVSHLIYQPGKSPHMFSDGRGVKKNSARTSRN